MADDVQVQNEHKEEGSFLEMATPLLLPYIKEIVTWFAVGAMILGGIVPYIPQYREIKKSRNSEGFSVYVCLVLLIANILRIFFWFGVHYELPLLLQSIIMIITMLAMMHICVTVKKESSTSPIVHRSLLDLNYFWKWTEFRDYLIFIGVFSGVGLLITFLLIRASVFVELLGFASLMTEAMLGVPQFLRNYRNKSTEGMSVQMVLFWTSGDTFKTVYFILRSSPVQFGACGLLQVIVDIAILLQVVIYRKKRQFLLLNKP